MKKQVIIIGGGVSGLLLAHYLSSVKNRQVTVITTTDELHCTYCTWRDEVVGTWLYDLHGNALFSHIWKTPIHVGENGVKGTISRDYVMFDNEFLVRVVKESELVEVIDDTVCELVEGTSCVRVHTERGYEFVTDALYDASGHYSQFTLYDKTGVLTRRYQSFYGETLKLKHGLDLDTCVLMDWSLEFKDGYPPSFVYVLPLSGDEVLVEETVLVSTVKIPYDVLCSRLRRRKEVYDLDSSEVVEIEKYHLPMGGDLPSERNIVTPIGGAAHAVHPATGYMIGFVINQIPMIVDRPKLTTFHSKILRHLDDMGAHVITKLDTTAKMSTFTLSMFKSPYWFGFMTRRLTILKYILNMIVFTYNFDFRHILMYHILLRVLFTMRTLFSKSGI